MTVLVNPLASNVPNELVKVPSTDRLLVISCSVPAVLWEILLNDWPPLFNVWETAAVNVTVDEPAVNVPELAQLPEIFIEGVPVASSVVPVFMVKPLVPIVRVLLPAVTLPLDEIVSPSQVRLVCILRFVDAPVTTTAPIFWLAPSL